jgi:ABC-type molybdate transport system permease subunit
MAVPSIIVALMVIIVAERGGFLDRLIAPLGLSLPKLVRDDWGAGVILATVWKQIPFMTLIISSAFAAIPEDLRHAARSFGASRLKTFVFVEVPLAMPGITAAILLTFIGSMGSYAIPDIVGPPVARPLSVLMVNEFNQGKFPQVYAMGMVLSLFAVVVLIAYYTLTARIGVLVDGDGFRAHRYARRTLSAACDRHGLAPGQTRMGPVGRDGENVRLAEEPGGEGAGRGAVKFERRAGFNDPATIHDDDPVGHRHCFRLVMRNVDAGGADPFVEIDQLLAQRVAQLGVKIGQRLIEQQQTWLHDDGAGQRHALLLAAGQLTRHAIDQTGQIADVQGMLDAPGALRLRHIFHSQPEAKVLADRHMRKKCVGLENHSDIAGLRR